MNENCSMVEEMTPKHTKNGGVCHNLCLSTTFYLKCYSPIPLVKGEGPASYRRDLDMFIPSGATRQQVTGRKPVRDHCVKSE